MSTTLPPGVNVVAVTQDLRLRNALARVFKETGGIAPATKSKSISADRLHYQQARSKLIVNTAHPQMQKTVGGHCVAFAIECDDRLASAELAQKIFEDAGFSAIVHRQAEPEFETDFLTFVEVPALLGIVLMYWPRMEYVMNLPSEVRAKLPTHIPCTEDDYKE